VETFNRKRDWEGYSETGVEEEKFRGVGEKNSNVRPQNTLIHRYRTGGLAKSSKWQRVETAIRRNRNVSLKGTEEQVGGS